MTEPDRPVVSTAGFVHASTTFAFRWGLTLAIVLSATFFVLLPPWCNGECYNGLSGLFELAWLSTLFVSPVATLLALIAWGVRNRGDTTRLWRILAGIALNAGLALWSVWMLLHLDLSMH